MGLRFSVLVNMEVSLSIEAKLSWKQSYFQRID